MAGGGILWKIVALSVAKKLSVLAIARLYGFPRLYRRMMEVNRRLVHDKSSQDWVRDKTQAFFRFPRHVSAFMRNLRGGRTEYSIGFAGIPLLATNPEFIKMSDALETDVQVGDVESMKSKTS
ncbi:hypothetical protein NDN08_004668 [Rhodosorus marinus]|uniref:Protein-serine/threonine kinase n=1 Tax=Rhodosorus marinus TaxID=101924 RepID=A0AAV8UNE4_9RHOD|nr:hypothetical protein NDN08_004668 [Rhodosorus marinus]